MKVLHEYTLYEDITWICNTTMYYMYYIKVLHEYVLAYSKRD